MKDAKQNLLELLDKAELSPEEREWFLNYLEGSHQHELMEILEAEFKNNINDAQPISPFVSQRILNDIHRKLDLKNENYQNRYTWIKRLAVAASVVGILLIGSYFYKNRQESNLIAHNQVAAPFKNDIKPPTERAILLLADGVKIALEQIKNGTVINQGGSNIIKTNGELAYNTNGNNTVLFNTLSTPRAGHYRVKLPDGTQVWLNSASSLHYPTAFTGNKRVVDVTGEVYFEVAKNKKMPFIVRVNNSEVRVYGTHFNVMAYKDEQTVKTTLLEGSVKCVKGALSCMLKPGQQSELNKNGKFKIVANVDVHNAVAWKNGMFNFKDADIEEIMRQLSRAYDVEVVYNKKITDHFYADIPVNSKLSEVLKALELTGTVNFDIRGRQIIVNP